MLFARAVGLIDGIQISRRFIGVLFIALFGLTLAHMWVVYLWHKNQADSGIGAGEAKS